jgi:hypothetical protein
VEAISMALQLDEVAPTQVEAIATKVMDRWVVEVLGNRPLTVRVRSLADLDAAVDDVRRSRRRPGANRPVPVRVHVQCYRSAS